MDDGDGRGIFPDRAAPFGHIHGVKMSSQTDFPTQRLYLNEKEAWRKIDHDWLRLAGDLAIKLSSQLNNSSLVLAIELGKNGKVLLFPGDAEEGSWHTWRDLKWNLDDRVVTMEDLLARTVVYKVGHHGSHNGTLIKGGLDKMTSTELTALISVDEKFATKKKDWEIPDGYTLDEIRKQCRGRVLRTDEKKPDILSHKPQKLSDARWKHFKKRIKVEKNFIQYTVDWK